MKIEICLMAAELQGQVFGIEGQEQEVVSFLYEFLYSMVGDSGISEDGKLKVRNPLIFSEDIRDAVDLLVAKYSKQVPVINRVKYDFFAKLKVGQPFIVYDNSVLSNENKEKFDIYLQAFELGKPYEELWKSYEETCGEIRRKYDIIYYDGHKKQHIGEKDKIKRVCRYCKGYVADGKTSYKKEAHTVSEALGNKNIFTYDECDKCNESFGAEIEQEFAKYLEVFNVFFSVRGKNGIPHVKTKNSDIKRDGNNIELKYITDDSGKEFSKENMSIEIKSGKLIWQKLYKALVKFTMGILPADTVIPKMQKTINWLCAKQLDEVELPLVATSFHPFEVLEHPFIAAFIRKDEDRSMPYVIGLFSYAAFSYCYVIPFTDENDIDFTAAQDRDRYWSLIKRYLPFPDSNWKFENWSSPKPEELVIKLNFKPQHDA